MGENGTRILFSDSHPSVWQRSRRGSLLVSLAVPLIVLISYTVAVLALVVADTIPDLFLRPLFSGDATHVGLLRLAYTLGPVVLGFYGLFFTPVVLVVLLSFVQEALPRLLGTTPEDGEGISRNQHRLDDF